MVSIAVGHKDVYLVNEKHECYIVQFEHLHEGAKQLQAKRFNSFIGKTILKVFSGYNFFVGLERNVQNMEEWSVERVAEWLKQIGFGSFVKIAKIEKMDGKMLKNITAKYMYNALGMTKLNMQQKLILSIQELQEGRNEYDQLWVWGKN